MSWIRSVTKAVVEFIFFIFFSAGWSVDEDEEEEEEAEEGEAANVAADEAANGAANGAADGAADGAANGAANGAADEAANGAADEAANGAVNGAADEAANGAADEAANGAADEAANGAAEEAANGAADEDHDHLGDADQLPDRADGNRRGEKRKRCAACYREAEDRRAAQAVKRVLTCCVICAKPFCKGHLNLYCGNCNVARLPYAPGQLQELAEERARNELERQNFQTTVERQQRDIEDLRQQVRVLIPLVSEIFILIYCSLHPLFRIRIWIHRIHMILGLPDPDPLVRGLDPDPDPALDPDPSIIMQK
jgi:hypothetical protein